MLVFKLASDFFGQSWARRPQHEPLTLLPLGRHFVLFQAKPLIMHHLLKLEINFLLQGKY
jgi:hypothetical protein